MYKFRIINGGEEDRWKWFSHPFARDFEVELRLQDHEELTSIGKEFRLGTENADYAGYRRKIATDMFRNFRGAIDANGDPIDNTLENRAAMLKDVSTYTFINNRLGNFAAWGVEGNGEGGSD